MSGTPDPDAESVYAEYRAFVAGFQTVLLATSHPAHGPEASYAPCVAQGHDIYIYVSELAAHTRNLMHNGQCGLLFIEDESATNNLFARRRVSFRCAAVDVARGSPEAQVVLDAFGERFGKFMQVLRSLQDFHLFRLTPAQGNYVAGFGKAYALSGEGLAVVSHRDMRARA